MGKRGKSEANLLIGRVHDAAKRIVAGFQEIEHILDNPGLSAQDKRLIRVELEKSSRYPKKPQKPLKSSLQLLSQASHLRDQATLYAAGGRAADARRIKAEAVNLEAEGKRLQREEAKPAN